MRAEYLEGSGPMRVHHSGGRLLCGAARPFEMKIRDNAEREVLQLSRPYRCDSCFFPCCLQELEVSAPPGNVIGFVRQTWTCIKPR